MRLLLAPGNDIAALVRGADAESLVVVIPQDLGSVPLAMTLAALEPLAVERAPATRVNAVLATATARAGDVDAAVAFLERAVSTTGQIIEVS